MKTYKITNTTNLFGKRERKYNSIVNIEFVDNRIKKTINLKAGESVFLTVQSLPLSIHRLRIKNFIEVTEANPQELIKPKPVRKPRAKKVVPVKKEVTVEVKKKPITTEKKEKPVTEKKITTKNKSSE